MEWQPVRRGTRGCKEVPHGLSFGTDNSSLTPRPRLAPTQGRMHTYAPSMRGTCCHLQEGAASSARMDTRQWPDGPRPRANPAGCRSVCLLLILGASGPPAGIHRHAHNKGPGSLLRPRASCRQAQPPRVRALKGPCARPCDAAPLPAGCRQRTPRVAYERLRAQGPHCSWGAPSSPQLGPKPPACPVAHLLAAINETTLVSLHWHCMVLSLSCRTRWPPNPGSGISAAAGGVAGDRCPLNLSGRTQSARERRHPSVCIASSLQDALRRAE